MKRLALVFALLAAAATAVVLADERAPDFIRTALSQIYPAKALAAELGIK
jgi:hypothetical protein